MAGSGGAGSMFGDVYLAPLDGMNVLEAAKARIREMYETHDTVAVSFSGGKDSLAVVRLCHEVGVKEGYTDRVVAWFRDEEIIASEIVAFMDGLRDVDWLDLHWWCVPLLSNKFFMGETTRYVQWDPARNPETGGVGWVRPMPENPVTLDTLGLPADTVLTQYDGNKHFVRSIPDAGTVAILTGVRADESVRRMASIARSGRHRERDCWHGGLNNFGRGADKRAYTYARPIYDWTENDIFRLFYDLQVPYCAVYDAQMWSRTPLRVSSSLTTSSAMKYERLRAYDPAHFQEILRIFPDVATQMRYWHECDAQAETVDIGTYVDLEAWCHETMEGDILAKGLKIVAQQRRRLETGRPAFDPQSLAREFLRGEHKRGSVHGGHVIQPDSPEAAAALVDPEGDPTA